MKNAPPTTVRMLPPKKKNEVQLAGAVFTTAEKKGETHTTMHMIPKVKKKKSYALYKNKKDDY